MSFSAGFWWYHGILVVHLQDSVGAFGAKWLTKWLHHANEPPHGGVLRWEWGNKDVHLVTTFVFCHVSHCYFFISRNFIVKTCPQNAEVWYRSRRWNQISMSYLCNTLKELIITIREQDDRVVWYWFLPRNTYKCCLPWLCMLNLCSNNTTDSVMLQRILWFLLESHTTDCVFIGCNQIASRGYQGWLNTNQSLIWSEVERGKYYLQRCFLKFWCLYSWASM